MNSFLGLPFLMFRKMFRKNETGVKLQCSVNNN